MYKATSPYHSIAPIARCMAMLVLPVLLIWLSACNKTFSSNQFADDKMVVLAEITAGDSMEIPIGKTIKVGGGGVIRFEKVNDATVSISDNNAHTFMLLPNWSAQYAANPTTVFTNRRHFKTNTTYVIDILHPTLGTVKASTHIPLAPKLIALDTSAEIFQGKNMLAATITWQDDGATDNYYIIEALKESVKLSRYFFYHGTRYNYDTPDGKALYDQVKDTPGVQLLRDTIPQNKFTRLQLYTGDNNTENSRIDNLENPFRRIFIPDHNFSGQNYTTKLYIDRQFFTATDPKKKGRVRIQLKSASKELYDYLLVYEKYKTDFGSVPTSQLTSPVGNIQNGLGIFGGSARKEHIFYFDTFW